ncbi:MAG: hypothetical protein J7M38_13210, partial [Armatimonadetes bacterium]|nr:hypothetical protein [Armatimonadota bacterium]
IEAALGEAGCRVEVRHSASEPRAEEVDGELSRLRAPQARVEVREAIDGRQLYELALALDRIRLSDHHPSWVMTTRTLQPAPEPHAMWNESMMAQPLGGLGMYLLDTPAAGAH